VLPAAVALAAPVLLSPRPEWMWAVLPIPAALLVNLALRRRFVEPNPLNPLLLPLLAMVGVSLWATFSIEFSLSKVAGTLLGVFVFWSVVQVVRDEKKLAAAVVLFCAGGLAFAVVALGVTRWSPRKFPLLGELGRLFPPRFHELAGLDGGFNPNPVGGTLLLFIPLFALLAWAIPRERRLAAFRLPASFVLGLSGLFLLGMLLLSQSRSAWIGLSAALLLWLALRIRFFRWIVPGGLALALLLILFAAPVQSVADLDPVFDDLAGSIGIEARMEIWNRAGYGIRDFPFTGMGMDTFRRVVHVLYPLFVISPDQDIANAHNLILQTALDVGIPGVVALMSIWAAVGILLVGIRRRTETPFRRLLAEALICGLAAQFVFQFTDAIPLGTKVGQVWWVAVGLAVALHRLEFGDVRCKPWEIARLPLLWALISLASISLIGDYFPIGMAIAVAGGAYLGWEAARLWQPETLKRGDTGES
jgi:putative inorganic carbon (hco3(-)) transporter